MINLLKRRAFLERSLQLALGAAASAWIDVPFFFQRALAAGVIPDGNKKLLFIFLRGGNDGLNTIVPWGDTAYNKTNRRTLYLQPPDPLTSVSGRVPTNPDLKRVIDLGNNFAGMHPGLVDLSNVYNDGQVAFIHRVGYPKQSRSHFDSQKYWENGTPNKNITPSGILYRAVANTGLHRGRQFPLVSVQADDPMLLRGPVPLSTNLSDPSRYDLIGVTGSGGEKQKMRALIAGEYRVPYPGKDNRDLLFGTGSRLIDALDALKTIGLTQNDFFDADGKTHLFPIDAASNQKKFGADAFSYFHNLKVAAQILAKTDALVAATTLDGFDTHNGQGSLQGAHASRMAWLGWTMLALRKFFTDQSPDLWKNMIVVTFSEFGRTSQENGSGGTDHAEAGAMIVAGGKIKGGVYQCGNDSWTVGKTGSMFQVNSRYLRRSVDYRSVLGEIIRDHLGASQAQLDTIIPGYTEPRECLLAGGVTVDATRIVGELGIL